MSRPALSSSRIDLPASLCSSRVTGTHRSYGRSDSSPGHLPSEVSPIVLFSHHDHSVATHPMDPQHPLGTRSLVDVLGLRLSHRFRLRHELAGSPIHKAVSRSSSYGLVVPFLLLSTPPHDDAVAVRYRRERGRRRKTFTLLSEHLLRRTSTALLGRPEAEAAKVLHAQKPCLQLPT